MMMFRTLKDNLSKILRESSDDRFVVVGHQQQVTDAKEVKGDNRRVQVFYDSGDFPKSEGSLAGPVEHEISFRVELTVSEASGGDLSVINNPNSTAAQISAAISRFRSAAEKADESMDELFELVFQILMDARNVDLCTEGPPFKVKSRWLNRMQKNEVVPQGEYVILTGEIDFTCQATEEVKEETGIAIGSEAYDSTIDLDGDDVEQTGVTVD